jgi:predicted phosphodiesterase
MCKRVAVGVLSVLFLWLAVGEMAWAQQRPMPRTPAELGKIAGWRGAAVNAADSFRFVVASDRTGGARAGAWARAVEQINRVRPDFVICVGDLIEGYQAEEAEDERMWREFDAVTRRLAAPFFYCPGNHDVTSPADRAVYIRLHGIDGRAYYSFDYRGCHFVVVDTTAIVNRHETADAQWTWLTKDLAAAKDAKHVFLFGHHPLYGRPLWRRLRAMLPAGRTTIFSGHWHALSYDEQDGIPYYFLGPTATQTRVAPREDGTFLQFAHVTVSAGRPTVAILPVGQVLAHDFVHRAVQRARGQIERGIRLPAATRGGGELTVQLANPTDAQVSYTLSWQGPADWFAAGRPEAARVNVAAGGAASHAFRLRPVTAKPSPPSLVVAYRLTLRGRQVTGQRRLRLRVIRAPATQPAGAAGD